jgi:4-amino-4-deoxy-L-arabinose transferase-like glycosyltransferase
MLHRLVSSPVMPVLVSLALGLFRLSGASLWADEGETYGAAVHRLQPYEHPVTYFWFMRFWMGAFGSSEFALRMPSVLSAVGLVFVVYRLARYFPIPRLAVWAAWLACLSPFVRLGAQEARMYAPMAFTQSTALWGILAYVNGHRRGAYLWAAGTAASSALHHLGWFACWPPWLIALIVSRNRRPLIGAGLVALGLYAPLFLPTMSQVLLRLQGGHMGSTPSLPAAAKKLFGQAYYMGAGYLFVRLDGASIRALASSPLLVIFAGQLMAPALLAVRGVRRLWASSRREVFLLMAFLLPTYLFLAYEGSPANLLLPVFAAYLVPLATGAAVSRAPLVIVLLMLWVPALVRQTAVPGYPLHVEDWRTMAATIRAQASPEDAVFLTGSRNSIFMTDYYSVRPATRYALVDSARVHAAFDDHLPRRDPSIVRRVEETLAHHPRVWLVYLDWDMPFMERSVDTLWTSAGRWRQRFGEGLELLRLERSAP